MDAENITYPINLYYSGKYYVTMRRLYKTYLEKCATLLPGNISTYLKYLSQPKRFNNCLAPFISDVRDAMPSSYPSLDNCFKTSGTSV